MTPEQQDVERAQEFVRNKLLAGGFASGVWFDNRVRMVAAEFAAVRAEATREAIETASKTLAHYPWLPCPICHGVEGCDHVVPERMRAHIESRALATAPAAREEGK